MVQKIKIRFNTEKEKTNASLPAWRVLIQDVEHFAESLEILVPCKTSKDIISTGQTKWHITCEGIVRWEGLTCRIERPISSGVIWLTGLPSAGKTTIANAIVHRLREKNFKVEHIDGDAVREVFPQTGFSKDERDVHLQRMGFAASLLEKQGVIVVASFITPLEKSRNFIRKICQNYFEVFVDTPLSTCEARDSKGLYQKARQGLITNFTGLDSEFEIPKKSEMRISTEKLSADEIADQVLVQFF